MDATYFVRSFVALFVIVDSVGNVPIFMTILDKFNLDQKRRIIRYSIILAAAALMGFVFFGRIIFGLLGISFSSFKIAGGLLLLIISVEMLFGGKSRTEMSPETLEAEVEEVSITPLAIPLLTGPGAITTAMVLYNDLVLPIDKIYFLLVVAAVFLVSYVILANMTLFHRILGRMGTKVITRLMGLILMSLSIEFMLSGIHDSGLLTQV